MKFILRNLNLTILLFAALILAASTGKGIFAGTRGVGTRSIHEGSDRRVGAGQSGLYPRRYNLLERV